MLDQRGAKEKGYITLKEAAKIANYSPDYIGQLIRAGKIKGEQVYANVAWVTTHEEVEAYLKDKGRKVTDKSDESSVLLQKVEYFSKYFLYFLITACLMMLLFLQYVLYVSIDAGLERSVFSSSKVEVQEIDDMVQMSSR